MYLGLFNYKVSLFHGGTPTSQLTVEITITVTGPAGLFCIQKLRLTYIEIERCRLLGIVAAKTALLICKTSTVAITMHHICHGHARLC